MATLQGTKPQNTYGNLLQVPNSNNGVDATLRNVEDGKGDSSALYLASDYGGLINKINPQTDNYTLVSADMFKTVTINKATAVTLTVPTNADQPMPVGTLIYPRRTGAGLLTIAGDVGVTVTASAGVLTDAGLNATMVLEKTGTDTWLLNNGTSPAWQDWSSSLAPTGFSALATQKAFYKDDGSKIEIWVHINGTSNANSFTFSVPFALNANYSTNGFMIIAFAVNGATGNVAARMYGSGGSATMTLDSTVTGTAWQTSGTKELKVSFFYQR